MHTYPLPLHFPLPSCGPSYPSAPPSPCPCPLPFPSAQVLPTSDCHHGPMPVEALEANVPQLTAKQGASTRCTDGTDGACTKEYKLKFYNKKNKKRCLHKIGDGASWDSVKREAIDNICDNKRHSSVLTLSPNTLRERDIFSVLFNTSFLCYHMTFW